MDLEQLQQLEREQWAEVQRLRKLAEEAGCKWSETARKVAEAKRETEVNRLVEERLADREKGKQ